MADDREERLAALRSRVASKLSQEEAEVEVTVIAKSNEKRKESSIIKQAKFVQESADMLIDSETVKEAMTIATKKVEEAQDMIATSDMKRLRSLASLLILAGSILGIISGALLMTGNPADLLNTSLFEESSAVDYAGDVWEAETGDSIEGALVELLDTETMTEIRSTVTDENGFYRFNQVSTEERILRVSKDGYQTVERYVNPGEAGERVITLTLGEGTITEGEKSTDEGWSVENAVFLSSAIGIFTVFFGLIGVQASIEASRGKKYRRTQYLAGLALFSRGLIIFGPALILLGMIILIFAKKQFEDLVA